MSFGERLEELLKAKSLSKKDLAERLNIRRASISEWKTKNIFPYADIACEIAQILGASVEWLVTGKDGLSDSERELLYNYRQLNAVGKEAAVSAVKGLAASFPLPLAEAFAKTEMQKPGRQEKREETA